MLLYICMHCCCVFCSRESVQREEVDLHIKSIVDAAVHNNNAPLYRVVLTGGKTQF